MPTFKVDHLKLCGISAAVPGRAIPVTGPSPDLEKITSSAGVKARHIASASVCSSDLCQAAAENLLKTLAWERSSIDLLVFVSQTPDYILPATSCLLHSRLGLSKECAAFDINLGCSGYVYGLSVVATHINAKAAKRALLLVGDTISKVISPCDRSVAYLFGDAGSATALEYVDEASTISFVTGSDGNGAEHLRIPAGMFRVSSSEATRTLAQNAALNSRSQGYLYMNGPEIFNFTLREVPPMVKRVLGAAGWGLEEVDHYVFHQANRFMLDYLVKRMGLPVGSVPMALDQFGNTSSASIPLTICSTLGERLKSRAARLVLGGFGVGFSWSAAALTVDRPVVLPVASLP